MGPGHTPAGFGSLGGKLLVGNEDDGHISIFDPVTGAYSGQLLDANGNPIANAGLWGLTFGNGGNGGDPNTLYFAAGINGEVDGLFGSLTAVPEPGSIILLRSERRWPSPIGTAWQDGPRRDATPPGQSVASYGQDSTGSPTGAAGRRVHPRSVTIHDAAM